MKHSRPTRSAQHAKPPAIVHDTLSCPCDACETTRAKDRPPAIVGYGRVSTVDQTSRQQNDALLTAGCDRVFIDDAVSGMKTSRPELDACLAMLQEGDTLVVWRLDRLGRSMSHLLATVESLANRGIAFRSLNESIDTSNASGRLILGIFAAIAQFERDLTVERINAALQAKKRRGEPVGRPRKLTPDGLATARRELDAGTPSVRVARTLGVSKATLYASLARTAANGAES